MGVYTNKENYLKALCINHPDVAHGEIVDGIPRRSFFRINNEEELTDSVLNDINYPCVAFIHIDGRMTDRGNTLQSIRHVFRNGWMFLDHVTEQVDEDGIGKADRVQEAFDTTFAIMEDFIKAMKDDFEEHDRCGAFENFDLNKINYRQVGPVQQNAYGWELYFDDEFKATRVLTGDDMGTVTWNLSPYRVDPEIIFIVNESSKVVPWTATRKSRFGVFPTVEVWLEDTAANNILYKAAIQPTVDAAPPNFTTMSFAFPGNVNGFIVIR